MATFAQNMIASRFALSMLAALSAAACVPRDQAQAPPVVAAPPPRPDRAAALEAEIARLRMWLVAREARIQEVSVGEALLNRQLQDVTSLNDEMSGRLQLSSQSLGQLAAERERLLAELAEAQAKLEQLDEQEAAPKEPAPEELSAVEPPLMSEAPALVSSDFAPEELEGEAGEVAVVPEPE